MNNFIRQTMLEDAYLEMHGIKPDVYYNRINRQEYQIKLVFNGREAIITEIMEDGLPKVVTLEYDGKIENFKFPIEAENRITEHFKE